jgi:cell division protease FtsH
VSLLEQLGSERLLLPAAVAIGLTALWAVYYVYVSRAALAPRRRPVGALGHSFTHPDLASPRDRLADPDPVADPGGLDVTEDLGIPEGLGAGGGTLGRAQGERPAVPASHPGLLPRWGRPPGGRAARPGRARGTTARAHRLPFRTRQPALARASVAAPAKVRQAPADVDVPTTTFADVAGVDEAVEELAEIKQYLLDPERFEALGASLPKGVLLVGPPGTGKTLLTRALAGEAGVPFQVVSAASLVEVYVGVGPARVRDLFARARKHAPSIVLIDELDAIGRCRTHNPAGGQEERESTLNQLLLEMDGFDAASGVLVVGATNRPEVLDPALLRPGRFDRRLVVPLPDLRGREAILAVHARGKPLDLSTDLAAVARRTAGFTGADLANVLNEAALLAGRRYKDRLGGPELDEAIDRVLSGPRRPSLVLSPRDREVFAYHEAGHVMVARAVAHGQEVHRVSIVARGMSHGHTLSVPIEERLLLSRSELLAQLAVLLGGRAAEELVFCEPTTGAQDDLARASAIARKMVAEFGMSEAIGPVCLPGNGDGVVDAALVGGPGNGAGDLGADAAAEIRRLVAGARERAGTILDGHRRDLDRLAQRLMVAETLEKPEIDRLLGSVRAA